MRSGEHPLPRLLEVGLDALEPNILFDYFFARAEAALGADAGDRFLVVTDPGRLWNRRRGAGVSAGSSRVIHASEAATRRFRTSQHRPRGISRDGRRGSRCALCLAAWRRGAGRRPPATRASRWGPRWRSWRRGGARTSSRFPSALRWIASGCGRSSSLPRAPERKARGSCRWKESRWGGPRSTGRIDFS